jgi:hypothetical protein
MKDTNMKRLMLTALMGLMVMGQVEAIDTNLALTKTGVAATIAGAFAAPVVAGALTGLGMQAAHVASLEQRDQLVSAFIHGRNHGTLRNGLFKKGNIPSLRWRIADWIRYYGKNFAVAAFGATAFWLYLNKNDCGNALYGRIPGGQAALAHLLMATGTLAATSFVAKRVAKNL